MSSAADEYLRANGVEKAISQAVATVLRERPSNPVAAIGRILAPDEAALKPLAKRTHGSTLVLFDVDGSIAPRIEMRPQSRLHPRC